MTRPPFVMYMIRLLFLLILAVPFQAFTQNVSTLLHQGAQLESAFNEEEALKVYQQALHIEPHNIIALCHCSDLDCRIGNRQESKEKKMDYFKAARSYADSAYQLDSTNSEVNIVMAFSIGRIILLQSGREKVAGAGAIKRYAENAIKYDPANYKAWHILGRWHYEVSGLGLIERTLARWFYGALPDASLQESIRDYEKSMALRPDFMLNYLELAKACHRDGQKARAIQLLQHLGTLTDEMYDDRTVRREGQQLLAEWQE
jgi:tetratricopeptide (TPR) repeat protein